MACAAFSISTYSFGTDNNSSRPRSALREEKRMKKFALWSVLLLSVAGMTGCGSNGNLPDETSPQETPAETITIRLDDPVDVSLSGLLSKSRSELATLADDLLKKIE